MFPAPTTIASSSRSETSAISRAIASTVAASTP
jgi:hypothetical protein